MNKKFIGFAFTCLGALGVLLYAQPRQNIYSLKAQKEFEQALTASSNFGVPRYLAASLPTCGATAIGAVAYTSDTLSLQVCNGSAWVGVSSGIPTYPLLAPNGTAAAPSYSFTNSTNSGMFLSSVGVVDFVAAGNANLRVTGLKVAMEASQATTICIDSFAGGGSCSSSAGVGIGNGVSVTATNSVAIGGGTSITLASGTAVGSAATTTGSFGTAVGANTSAAGSAVAVGNGTTASAGSSVVIGSGLVENANGVINIAGRALEISKTLSNTSATVQAVFQATVASNSGGGAFFSFCVNATDTVDFDRDCGTVDVAYVNKAAAFTFGTCTIIGNSNAVTKGTLSDTCSVTSPGAGLVNINIIPAWTVIVPTAVTIHATLLQHDTQAIAFQ
jgi:hypothetical protein